MSCSWPPPTSRGCRTDAAGAPAGARAATRPGSWSRRRLLAAAAALPAGCAYWPDEGLLNPCESPALPPGIARDERLASLFDGIAPERLWDVHVHVLGTGGGGAGTVWVNPRLRSLLHPVDRIRYELFANAACARDAIDPDGGYLARLRALARALPEGMRLVLLAFDLAHDEAGRPRPDRSLFHVPDEHARRLAAGDERFEWIASVHPYREDAAQALERAARGGARGVKWLPQAMGMDPASPRCDPFYAALARLGLPLLSHAGDELAATGAGAQSLGNPLRLRRALEHGVKVVVAHCASLGEGEDLDRPGRGPRPNIDLFARLMDDHRYEGRLLGDVSSIAQRNRLGHALDTVLERDDWHPRLLHGSDYPLPGLLPLYSTGELARRGYLDPGLAALAREVRRHDPLRFELLVKRGLRRHGKRLADAVFDTRRHLAPDPPGG